MRLDTLPTAVLAMVLEQLDLYDRARAACACRALLAAADEAGGVLDVARLKSRGDELYVRATRAHLWETRRSVVRELLLDDVPLESALSIVAMLKSNTATLQAVQFGIANHRDFDLGRLADVLHSNTSLRRLSLHGLEDVQKSGVTELFVAASRVNTAVTIALHFEPSPPYDCLSLSVFREIRNGRAEEYCPFACEMIEV